MFSRQPSSALRATFYLLLTALFFAVTDWCLLVLLPRLGLSFGHAVLPASAWNAARAILLLLTLGFFPLTKNWRKKRNPALFSRMAAILFIILHLGLTVMLVDAFYIEPFALGVTRLEIPQPQANTSSGLHILHISDLHVEYTTPREEKLLQIVQEMQPDMIVLTGDYLNLSNLDDPRSLQDVRSLLYQLRAPAGVYAVNGTVDDPVRMAAIFNGLEHITVLDDQVIPVTYNGVSLQIIGVSDVPFNQVHRTLEELADSVPASDFSLLLHHTPDLVQTASTLGIDLYLAGHTHGGQVRLPFYGAVITFSRFGKQYEQGLYRVEETTLYVTRGVGMEGSLAPRMRFLCQPEVELITLD